MNDETHTNANTTLEDALQPQSTYPTTFVTKEKAGTFMVLVTKPNHDIDAVNDDYPPNGWYEYFHGFPSREAAWDAIERANPLFKRPTQPLIIRATPIPVGSCFCETCDRVIENAKNTYWGVCPECHKHDGTLNIGKSHWYFCKEHKTCWCVGANLFSTWRDQTLEQQRKIYSDLAFDTFTEVTSHHTFDAETSPECTTWDEATAEERAPVNLDDEFNIDECMADVYPFVSWDALTSEQQAAITQRIETAKRDGRLVDSRTAEAIWAAPCRVPEILYKENTMTTETTMGEVCEICAHIERTNGELGYGCGDCAMKHIIGGEVYSPTKGWIKQTPPTNVRPGWYGFISEEGGADNSDGKTKVRVSGLKTAEFLRKYSGAEIPAEIPDDAVFLECVTGYLGKRPDWLVPPENFTPDPEGFYFHGHVGDDAEWMETVAEIRREMIADGWTPKV